MSTARRVYDAKGRLVRAKGKKLTKPDLYHRRDFPLKQGPLRMPDSERNSFLKTLFAQMRGEVHMNPEITPYASKYRNPDGSPKKKKKKP